MIGRLRKTSRTVLSIALLGLVVGLSGPAAGWTQQVQTPDDTAPSIKGVVEESDGSPAADVPVRADSLDPAVPDQVGRSDENGWFTITGLEVSRYHVVAEPETPSYDRSWFPLGMATQHDAEVVSTVAGERTFLNGGIVVGDLQTIRNLTPPEARGDARVNEFLLARGDSWTQQGVQRMFMWRVDGHHLGSETGDAFLPRDLDLGKRVTVEVFVVKRGFHAARAISNPTATVAQGVLRMADQPEIEGERAVGSMLRVDDGSWRTGRGREAGLSSTHRWERDGAVVGTGRTYRVTRRDAGARLTVRVVVRKKAHRASSASVRANVAKVRSRTSVTVRSVERGRVALRVKVRAAGQVRPRGTLVVRDGRKVVRRVGVPRDGRVAVRLTGLRSGRHTLTAVYVGDGATKRSHDRVRVTVRR